VREKPAGGARVRDPRLTARDGKAVIVPEAAVAVRKVFELAAAGYGVSTIVKKLKADKVPPIGRTGRWTLSYVSLLLRDGRARGVYQPYHGREKDGPPVAGYYPAVVDDETWYRARAGIEQRLRNKGGKQAGEGRVNLFAGLLKCPHTGDHYILTQRVARTRKHPDYHHQFSVLVNAEGESGQARQFSIPYGPFETIILRELREIPTRDILGGEQPPGRDPLKIAVERARREPLELRNERPEKYAKFISIAGWLQVEMGDHHIMLPVEALGKVLGVSPRMVSGYRKLAIKERYLRELVSYVPPGAGEPGRATEFVFDVTRWKILSKAFRAKCGDDMRADAFARSAFGCPLAA
jgi:hypothetical protein